MKIRAGDSVVITTGKDKGKTGKVLRVLEAKNRVVVTDVAIRTRHVKGGPNRPGEIVKYEASIALSNVMIIDPKTKKRSRVGFKKNEKGHKIRIAKISGEEIKKGTVAAKKETAAKLLDKLKDSKYLADLLEKGIAGVADADEIERQIKTTELPPEEREKLDSLTESQINLLIRKLLVR